MHSNLSLQNTIIEGAKQDLVTVARLMISEELDIFEGSRLIVTLSHKLNIASDEVFLPIIGFESQTDQFPIGKAREQFNKGYLEQLDLEKQKYVDERQWRRNNTSCRKWVHALR